MVPRLPPLHWLRAFEAAARHLSFTHAAAELNLTQAAISKQVKLLELHLREPLFERKARSLVLTKGGGAYLPKVQDAFDRLGAGTYEIFGHRRTEMLTIRAVAGFAVNWLAPRLPLFLNANPDVPVRIISTVWNEDNDPTSYDQDIRYGLGHWSGFRSDRISWEVLAPVCAPETANRLKTPADLADERLLHVLGYQDGWATWLDAAGATGVDAATGTQFDTSLLAFAVAAAGGGVALGRASMMAKDIGAGQLVQPFALTLPVREAFYLLTPQAGVTTLHPGADLFRNWLLDQALAGRADARSANNPDSQSGSISGTDDSSSSV